MTERRLPNGMTMTTPQRKTTAAVDPCFKDLPANPPVGLWFHSFNENEYKTVRWQGRVVAKISETDYLVLLFEWLVGDVAGMQIVTLDEMRSWQFYDTKEWWHDSYQHDLRRRGDAQDRKEKIA